LGDANCATQEGLAVVGEAAINRVSVDIDRLLPVRAGGRERRR
jgi:hypothetical protein